MPTFIDRATPVIAGLLLLGCSAPAEAHPGAKAPLAKPEATASAPVQPMSSKEPTAVKPVESATALEPAPLPVADPKTGEMPRAIPELSLQLSGLHIGGGPNDAVSKRPFTEVLEGGFSAMRVCYVKAEEPEKGGTFGVDLRIERDGGHPTIQAVRTKMKGDAFRSCVEDAFRGLEFSRPAKGPTVLSASVRFSLQP